MPRVFLYAPQDFRNLCVVARTLEVLGYGECLLFDPKRLVRERYGKSRTREARVVSAGAFERVRWVRVEDPTAFLAADQGRTVATVADASAPRLEDFRFTQADLLLFGSESHGLPPEVVTACAATLTIRAHGVTQSLNLAVSLGIVLFEAGRQTRHAGPA